MKKMKYDNNVQRTKELRTNGQIRARQVRVIDNEGTMLGVMDFHEAFKKAKDISLDLVEVNPHDQIPTCKIMDYGKYKYDRDKKAKDAKKSRTTIETKEVKFRPTIGQHDYEVKMRQVRTFIEEGNKVHVSLQMRGRQIDHPEMAKLILDRIINELGDYVVSLSAESDEKSMNVVLIKNHKRQKQE
jgi:translation initiation factor IF-3